MQNPSRILIVEDNSDDEVLLMRQLKKAELHEHVKILRDGRAALNFLRDVNERISAVFLDLKLPKVSGIQVLAAIRSDERLWKLPVIVMTSSNSLEEMDKCRSLGISAFVQKPLTFSSFAKAFADVFHAKTNSSIRTPLRYVND